MYRIVSDILQLEIFKDARVVAGEKGLTRIVNNATLMEVPDIIPYVEANTLLITTMYPIAGEKDKIETLIPQLYEKNASGICIKPLRYINEVPEVMLTQAEEFSFPVIELPAGINLSACVNAILSVSLDDFIQRLQFRNQVHQSLIELLLAGASIEALTKKLAETVGKDVMLLDKDYMNICFAVYDKEMMAWTVIRGAHGQRLDLKGLEENKDSILCPIQAGASLFGFIYIRDDNKDENLRIAAEQAAMLFAAVFFKDDVASLHRKTFRDGFLRELLQGKIKNETELEKKKEAFDVSFVFPIYILVIKLLSDNETQKKRFYNRLIDERLAEKQIQYTLGDKNHQDMVYFDDALVVLVHGKKERELVALGENLKKSLEEIGIFNNKIGIGISQDIKKWENIRRGYKQAEAMVNIGQTIYEGSYVSTYHQNQVYELIEKIGDSELLKEYVRDRLGAVLEYDQKNGMNLMETLKGLIESNFNYKKTAEHSYLHYNTIRYRANKIQQLGISFEQGQNLAETIFAYNIYLWLLATDQSL